MFLFTFVFEARPISLYLCILISIFKYLFVFDSKLLLKQMSIFTLIVIVSFVPAIIAIFFIFTSIFPYVCQRQPYSLYLLSIFYYLLLTSQ